MTPVRKGKAHKDLKHKSSAAHLQNHEVDEDHGSGYVGSVDPHLVDDTAYTAYAVSGSPMFTASRQASYEFGGPTGRTGTSNARAPIARASWHLDVDSVHPGV
jgi:hypothetical protein